MLKGFIWLDRPKSDDEIQELRRNSILENHDVFFPTHVVRKDDLLVGYFSVGTPCFPLCPCWFGQALSNRDSFSLINSVENMVSLNGAMGLVFPVPKTSPFYPLMNSMGYKSLGSYELFAKKF